MTSITRPPSIALVALLLCLVAGCDLASALASPSPLKSYHFGATATASSKKVTASDLNRKKPRSYVPDGLTEEQYRQIRNDELAQQQSMKFGAWGPRFKQIGGDPDSNWFNLPSLWTGGFSANDGNDKSLMNTGSGSDGVERTRRLASFLAVYLRRYGLAYLMLLLSTQLLAKSLSAKKFVATKWVAARIVVSFAALKPMKVLATAAGRWKRLGWLNNDGTTKLAGVFAVLMTMLSFVLR